MAAEMIDIEYPPAPELSYLNELLLTVLILAVLVLIGFYLCRKAKKSLKNTPSPWLPFGLQKWLTKGLKAIGCLHDPLWRIKVDMESGVSTKMIASSLHRYLLQQQLEHHFPAMKRELEQVCYGTTDVSRETLLQWLHRLEEA